MTVKQLKRQCERLIRGGLGDRYILMSSDDECNSFHALWQGFEVHQSEIDNIAEAGMFHDNDNPEDVVLLS